MIQATYKYANASKVILDPTSGKTTIDFAQELSRSDKVSFWARIINPIIFRDSMLCLQEIVMANYQRTKDKSQYIEWMNMQLDKITLSILDSEQRIDPTKKEQLLQLYKKRDAIHSHIDKYISVYKKMRGKFQKFVKERAAEYMWIFDPVISVHPDSVTFEAFSKDESVYAALTIDKDQFEIYKSVSYGTTNIDFSHQLGLEMRKITSDSNLEINIDPEGFLVQANEYSEGHLEKKIDLPETWVKGFIKTSTVSALPGTELVLEPIDMYNLIYYLKKLKEHKSPRSFRFICKNKEPIKVLMEPFNILIPLTTIYNGDDTEFRIWGRRRFLLLQRLIPLARSFTIKIIDSAFPILITADLPGIKFTLGLSGWIANSWSGDAAFSALSGSIGKSVNISIQNYLKLNRIATELDLKQKYPNLSITEIRDTINGIYRRGFGFLDPNYGKIRYRELFNIELPPKIVEPSIMELSAMKIIPYLRDFQISSKKIDEGESLFITQATFMEKSSAGNWKKLNLVLEMTETGSIENAKCNCRFFSKNELRKGPCIHLFALQTKAINALIKRAKRKGGKKDE